MAVPSRDSVLVAGVDLATAEVRVAVADGTGRVVSRAGAPLAPPDRRQPGRSEQGARSWWPAVIRALTEAVGRAPGRVVAVAVSATSGTVVLADGGGEPVGPAVLYDDTRWPAPARWDGMLDAGGIAATARHAWHASDLVVAHLVGGPPPTDWSHALKTGYDPGAGRWSDGPATRAAELRPQVRPPTSPAGTICAEAAAATGLPPDCQVRLGMTDGCAAQLAAGADRPGRFVTVLGTTLVVKGVGDHRVDDPASGVYSHLHPNGWWLPGGASNVGGGSLTSRFPGSPAALDEQARERGPASVVCYPLSRPGERFPFVSAAAGELWVGEPADEVDAYRAVLEGVAFVERQGYERLAALGAPMEAPSRTAGGGAASTVWSAIRATVLGVPIARPAEPSTAFGACILAATGTLHTSLAAATDAMVAVPGDEVEPVAAERGRLDDSYGRFVDAIREREWIRWPA